MELAQSPLIHLNSRIIMAGSATTKASQLQLEAITATAGKKAKPTRLLVGQAWLTIPGKEFLLVF